jgi:hypothetical protein
LTTTSKSQTLYLRHGEVKSISFYFPATQVGTEWKEYAVSIGTWRRSQTNRYQLRDMPWKMCLEERASRGNSQNGSREERSFWRARVVNGVVLLRNYCLTILKRHIP